MVSLTLPKDIVLLDELIAWGHENVLGTHPTTLEVTTEDFLTKNGNCIIGIKSSKSAFDFHDNLKKVVQRGDKLLYFLEAGPFTEILVGFGNSHLTLANKISLVLRKSEFISDRTTLIRCDKASSDLSRDLIQYLQNPNHSLHVKIFSYTR